MSDEKRTEEKKPITDKDLDKVSGGHVSPPSSGAGDPNRRIQYGPPPYPGKNPQPD